MLGTAFHRAKDYINKFRNNTALYANKDFQMLEELFGEVETLRPSQIPADYPSSEAIRADFGKAYLAVLKKPVALWAVIDGAPHLLAADIRDASTWKEPKEDRKSGAKEDISIFGPEPVPELIDELHRNFFEDEHHRGYGLMGRTASRAPAPFEMAFCLKHIGHLIDDARTESKRSEVLAQIDVFFEVPSDTGREFVIVNEGAPPCLADLVKAKEWHESFSRVPHAEVVKAHPCMAKTLQPDSLKDEIIVTLRRTAPVPAAAP